MATIEIKKSKLVKFPPVELLKRSDGDYRGYLGDKPLHDYFIRNSDVVILITEIKSGNDIKQLLVPMNETTLSNFDPNYNVRPSDKKIRITIG